MIRSTAFCALAALALAACAEQGEPSFGSRLRGEGDATAALGRQWERGQEMIEDGEALIEDGRERVERGERMIREGRRLKADAEEAYRMRSVPRRDEDAT
ncbi:MAG: hypothetical protein ACFBWO_09670 [Paracoccaceae bacterium]